MPLPAVSVHQLRAAEAAAGFAERGCRSSGNAARNHQSSLDLGTESVWAMKLPSEKGMENGLVALLVVGVVLVVVGLSR